MSWFNVLLVAQKMVSQESIYTIITEASEKNKIKIKSHMHILKIKLVYIICWKVGTCDMHLVSRENYKIF